MKMAPVLRAFAAHQPAISTLLVHTGQHYDMDMSGKLLEDQQLPQPDINLEAGSGSHAVQTAEAIGRFEPVVDERKPSCIRVVDDVNSTLTCALGGVQKSIPVVHVEAAGVDVSLIQGSQGFGIVAMYRALNDDDPRVLKSLLGVLREISESIPLMFALHPRKPILSTLGSALKSMPTV